MFDAKLPIDPRTLLRGTYAPIHQVKIGNGTYWHHGVEKSIRQKFAMLDRPLSISLNLNIDGLPIYNNGNASFWPILLNVHEFPKMHPMIAGIFHSQRYSKPAKVEEFLTPFVDEINPILVNGLTINGHTLTIGIRAIICDLPARAFIKGTPNLILGNAFSDIECTFFQEHSTITANTDVKSAVLSVHTQR